MTQFDFVVVVGLFVLAWCACLAVVSGVQLRWTLQADAHAVQGLQTPIRHGRSLVDLSRNLREATGHATTLTVVWRNWAQGFNNPNQLLDRMQSDRVDPVFQRILNLSVIAPAVGMLFTVAAICVGLTGQDGDAQTVAGSVIGVLPTALLSTVVALALSVGLRIAAGSINAAWTKLRIELQALHDLETLGEPPALRQGQATLLKNLARI